MGIGDFGVGAGGNPYTYNTSEFLGNFSWQNLNLQESGNAFFTNQLNVVLQFVQDGVTYAYWIQDVAIMDTATNNLSFENNIWNMTTSSSCLNNTGVSGNGTVYPISGCEGYYAVTPTTQPGSNPTMPNPGDFGLLVRSYEAAHGIPEVAFEYWDGVTSYYVTYDNVVWPWATTVSQDNNFLVDGSQYNPGGWFYDAELIIGGPGGGSSTSAQDPTHTESRLLYWNGHNFEATPSAWNFAGNTAETVSNIQSIFSSDPAGLPLTMQLNGTTRNATPAEAYDQNRVGELTVSASGISKGTVAIPGDTWAFVNDSASLTLTPGRYQVWVNSTLGSNDLGSCHITADATLSVSVASPCDPIVSTPTGSVESVDLGQSVTFKSTLEAPGSGGDTYVWHVTPNELGCTPSTSLTLSCTPTVFGTYEVNVTVTDSSGDSTTSGALEFTVDPDPALGVLTVSPATIDLGETLHFTSAGATGGAGSYRYVWTGLPAGCSSSNTTTLACLPSAAGSGVVELVVYDANDGSNFTSVAFRVYVDPTLSGLSVLPGSADLGQSVTFSAAGIEGGTGTYTYRWSDLPIGCSSANTSLLVCLPTGASTTYPTVNVTDSNGISVERSVGFAVYLDPSVGTPVGKPGSVTVGQTVRFSVNASGGPGSFTYTWSGLPAGCFPVNASNLTCRPSNPGTFTITVNVTDSNGVSAHSGILRFDVSKAPVPATFLGLPTVEGYALLAVLAVLAMIGIIVFVRRSRRRRNLPPAGRSGRR